MSRFCANREAVSHTVDIITQLAKNNSYHYQDQESSFSLPYLCNQFRLLKFAIHQNHLAILIDLCTS